jgi:hypothetical protein
MEHHHHHPQYGPEMDGLESWWFWPVIPVLLLALLVLWVVVRDIGGADVVGGARAWLAAGTRARWRAAATRHGEVAAAFATYECNPQAVLRRPTLADVRQPATARFVEAFAEACALATDRYPGRAATDAFMVAVDRSARAWTAATQAADRMRDVQFKPGERALLDQAAALLTLARNTTNDAERTAAYRRAAQRLADLERRCGWVLPQQATAVLRHEARPALTSSPA